MLKRAAKLKPSGGFRLKRLAEQTRARLNVGSGANVELRLPRGWPESDSRIHWRAHSAAGALHAGTAAAIDELPEAARSARVQVWTPPAETVLTRAQLPTRSRAKILQALPYALEDQLIDEPEKLHFAYAHDADGWLAVAVTARARMAAWLTALHAAGIRPAGLCPATFALPRSPDSWVGAFVDDEFCVRTGTYGGFACAATTREPPPLLASALREADASPQKPARLVVLKAPPGFDAERWRATLGIPVVVDNADIWGGQDEFAPPLNLLQSDYAPAGQAHQLLRPLRPAAILLAVWLVAGFALDVVEWVKLRSAYRSTTAEMRDIFQQSFPDTKTVLDPAAQMQRNLETLQSRGGAASDLLPLLTHVAPTLQRQQQARLLSFKYADRSLTLDLILPDYQALDNLRNSLQSANLDVEVLSANGRQNEVEGRLRVQTSGARAKPKA